MNPKPKHALDVIHGNFWHQSVNSNSIYALFDHVIYVHLILDEADMFKSILIPIYYHKGQSIHRFYNGLMPTAGGGCKHVKRGAEELAEENIEIL
jgi:hypothetical protein